MNIRIMNPPRCYQSVLSRISETNIVPRIWANDHTVWHSSPEEIVNRLGWLHLPNSMASEVPRINRFANSVRKEGFTHAVLLGMGGSSLAPDMLAQVLGVQEGYLQLRVLDSTHPDAVQRVADDLAHKKTLFIVATKSGTTTETLSLFRYFYRRMTKSLGVDCAGERFIAITDPDTPLVEVASQHAFRDVFLNNPNLGGRYSALSMFGLVPAVLLGLDIDAFIDVARLFAAQCEPPVAPESNPAEQLGSVLGASALEGRDKATFFLSRPIAAFGDWIEQLIAESTGKDGKGIVPVLENSLGRTESYGQDRVFIAVQMGDDPEIDLSVSRLAEEGRPVVRIDLENTFELAEQFYLWEFATAIACHVLGVHPFNQPNVESAKQLAKRIADKSRLTGNPPLLERIPLSHQAIAKFLTSAKPGDYVGLHAYLPPTVDLTASLQNLRTAIRDRDGIAVTLGYGPRFLHSTALLHKGDSGSGHFIQLVSETMPGVPIPDSVGSADSSLSFGALITSQAVGDRQALEARQRSVLTLGVPEPYPEHIETVSARLSDA